jgi:long-chain acyl-CoA synthetase
MSGFIRSGERQLVLGGFRERAARAAGGFAAEGVGDAGVVALLLRNDFAFLEAMFAANLIGSYTVPINWHFQREEVRYILADCGASHLVAHADLLAALGDAVPPRVRVLAVAPPPELQRIYGATPGGDGGCDDWDRWRDRQEPWTAPAVPARGSMFYTSGTTGRPKGVKRRPVPAGDRAAVAQLRAQWFGHRPGMRTAMIGPMYHSVQSSYAIASVASEGSVILMPCFEAEEVLRLIERERLTHLHLVPTMMSRLVRLPEEVRRSYDLSSLEFVIHGAAPCPRDVKRALIAWWGPIIHEYYGTTEAGMVSRCSSAEWLAREGTVGRPWPGRVVRICDADGQQVPARTEGRVYMSLGQLPDFDYHNAPDKRAAIEHGGLITSADIGFVDEDGYLFLCDREDDTVISGGVNVYPAEVEEALAGHPAVRDCAVFGIPDAEFGEALAAVVQPAGEGLSAEELRAFLRARIAHFKVPRHFEFRSELPRDDSGKIFRRVLRAPYWPARG